MRDSLQSLDQCGLYTLIFYSLHISVNLRPPSLKLLPPPTVLLMESPLNPPPAPLCPQPTRPQGRWPLSRITDPLQQLTTPQRKNPRNLKMKSNQLTRQNREVMSHQLIRLNLLIFKVLALKISYGKKSYENVYCKLLKEKKFMNFYPKIRNKYDFISHYFFLKD